MPNVKTPQKGGGLREFFGKQGFSFGFCRTSFGIPSGIAGVFLGNSRRNTEAASGNTEGNHCMVRQKQEGEQRNRGTEEQRNIEFRSWGVDVEWKIFDRFLLAVQHSLTFNNETIHSFSRSELMLNKRTAFSK